MKKFTFKNCITDVTAISKEFEVITNEMLEQDVYPVEVVEVGNQVHIQLDKPYRGADKVYVELDFSNITDEMAPLVAKDAIIMRLAYGDSHFEFAFTDLVNLNSTRGDDRDYPNKKDVIIALSNAYQNIMERNKPQMFKAEQQ